MRKLISFLLGAFLTGLIVKLVVDHYTAAVPPFEWWQLAILVVIFVLGQAFLGVAFGRFRVLFVLQMIAVMALTVFLIVRSSAGSTVKYAAIKVCGGEGVTEAASYNPTATSLHPIVLLDTFNGSTPKDEEYPTGWLPKDVNGLQLVGCLNENWQTVETCQYSGSTAAVRQQEELTIEIRSAKNGQLVKTIVLKGGMPAACAPTASFKPGTTRVYIGGDAVPLTTILEQLTSWVAP